MIIKRISLKEKSQPSNSKVQGAFLQVAMELAIKNAYALVAVVFFAGLMVTQLNKSDAAELSTFYSNHLEVGRDSSRGAYGCSQYTSSRLAGRINDSNVLETAASSTSHTAWDGTSMTYAETTFTLLDGQVTASVGCDLLPSGAVNSTATTTRTYPGLVVTYSDVDDSVCSSIIGDLANNAWVVSVGSAATQRIVKAYNEDSATGLYLDGTSVCNLGDGANTIKIYDRVSG